MADNESELIFMYTNRPVYKEAVLLFIISLIHSKDNNDKSCNFRTI